MIISVVIATRGRKELLQRCLEAVINQSLPKHLYEVVVVSDGPDDATAGMIRQYSTTDDGAQVKYYNLPVCKGPAAARNYGWRMAAGELIVFTDDDCIPERGWLAAIYRQWKIRRGDYVAFTGRIEVPHAFPPTDYERNIAQLETAEFVTANCAVSVKTLKLCGGFDESFTMAWREDSDLAFNLAAHNIPIVHLSHAIVRHPVRAHGWGVSLQEQKKSMFNALLYKKYPKRFREKIFPRPLWNYYVIVLSFLGALIMLLSGKSFAAFCFMAIWALFTLQFIFFRLRNTSLKISHIAEMTITSLVIPFLSIFWTLYGAFKFKTFFL